MGGEKNQVWRYGRNESGRETGCGETEAKETGRQTSAKAAPQDTLDPSSVSRQKSQVLIPILWWLFSNRPSR